MAHAPTRSLCCLAALTLLAAGCADGATSDGPETLTQRGLALTFDALADTDVAGVQYTVTGVDCLTGAPLDPALVRTVSEDLSDLFIPGGNATFGDNPLSTSSRHLFADHFFSLPAGCYDVIVQPVDAQGDPSQDCAPASASGVEVFEGATTEILLISQCVSDSHGGLDVIAALNHAPSILDTTYDSSKFICEDTTTLCLTATDADDDPLTIDWGAPSGATLVSQTQTSTPASDDLLATTTFCAEWSFDAPATYTFDATIYDLGYDAAGAPITIEELLAAQGDPNLSRASLTFPVHVMDEDACIDTCGCPAGFDVTPAGDECIKTTTELPTQNPDVLNICAGSTENAYGAAGGIFPGGTNVRPDPFFENRLNDIGVWACAPGSTTAPYGTNTNRLPQGEWIGFSVCLDIDQPGDYMLGYAVDNFIRVSINGAMPLTLPNNTLSFNYWHMNTISLNSGLNILEIEGKNESAPASIGADVYGPFASGSLTSDAAMLAADYENNIVWSTADIRGQAFTSGERAALICEGDDFVLNTCDAMPTCTKIERVPCQ